MLALARKVNESIILNDNIEVTVLEVKGDQVKIGINAPKMFRFTAKNFLYRYRRQMQRRPIR